MVTIMEFLLARLDEQEDEAQSLGPGHLGDPWRVRDAEAKRDILALHESGVDRWSKQEECGFCWTDFSGSTGEIFFESWPCPTVRMLAAPYADHPDYRPEWRF